MDNGNVVEKKPIARILNGDKAVGCGVLVYGGQVLTAAHVVNLSLDLPWDSRSRPRGHGPVEINFPFSSGKRLSGTVEKWSSPSEADIASIVLDNPEEIEVEPAALSMRSSGKGEKVRIFGLPKGYANGVWVYGDVKDEAPRDRVQIDAIRESGEQVRAGFSGAPVWPHDPDRPVVVGVIVQASPIGGTSLMVGSDRIPGHYMYSPEPQRSTDSWRFRFFWYQAMTALLNDLSGREADGLTRLECGSVKTMLEKVTNELSVLEDRTGHVIEWDADPYHVFYELRELYARWNSEKAGHEERSEYLQRLRSQRREFKSLVLAGKGVIDNTEELNEIADSIMGHFGKLSHDLPIKFSETKSRVAQYEKKTAGG